ncbi:MAG: general stress protein, partial [Acidobacteria bacterium]|nr:general stress protein [Acidobacteriota bacterium]
MKNTSVYGIYAHRTELENAIQQLQANQFRHEDISVLMPHNDSNKELATELNSKAPEGATAGGATGAVVG